MNTIWISAGAAALAALTLPAQAALVPDAVPGVVADRQDAAPPDACQLDGFLGVRLDANAYHRLLKVDEDRLLQGFRHRPGPQVWDGEHVGKWLHAATLAWVYTGDPALRAKLDRVVVALGECQLEDGYLGTYLPAQRWTEWDVWAHKYDMIGLLTYYRFTGNKQALEISRRCADLLCRTFGTGPGQSNILDAGWHMGMAPTSVLEPMVLLYRLTGEQKYLDFCRYIVAAWETPQGPKIVSTLLSAKRVDKVGNAKAYEMLSCLNGLLELYRITGDPDMLRAALNAWQDIVDKRLYITGTASYKEYFHGDYDLPNGNANVAETCVTVTWIQFNDQLLRLTGEARFADELERSVYNQLLGAQKPDGTAWGYYVQLEGKKPYSAALSGNCCLSSGPRGVALIPTFAFGRDADGAVINFLADGRARLTLRDGRRVALEIRTRYPDDGRVRITVHPPSSATFAVKVRIPSWCSSATAAVNDQRVPDIARPGDYAVLRRSWRDGDVITLDVPVTPRVIVGDHGNRGKVALACGPLVLAADNGLNPDAPIGSFDIPSTNLGDLDFKLEPAPADRRTWSGDRVYTVRGVLTGRERGGAAGQVVPVRLAPFAAAGCTLSPYQVWLPGGAPASETNHPVTPKPAVNPEP
jgi:DUF1680 family protein